MYLNHVWHVSLNFYITAGVTVTRCERFRAFVDTGSLRLVPKITVTLSQAYSHISLN